jgi:hypothetical protein
VKVRQRWERWEAIGAAALFVVFDEPAVIRRTMLDGLDVEPMRLEVLVDRHRETYDRWGLTRARRRDIWLDPNVYKLYWRLLRAGAKLRPGGSDVLQLGGDFIVDPHGKLAYSRPQRRDDRPPTGELLQAAARATHRDR